MIKRSILNSFFYQSLLLSFFSQTTFAMEVSKGFNATSSAVATAPSTMRFYYQDPTVMSAYGQDQYTVKTKNSVSTLEDKDLIVIGNWRPNSGNDFLYQQKTPEFDAASTFATVRRTYDLTRADLGVLQARYANDQAFSKAINYWDGRTYGQLKIETEAGSDANAYYDRNGTDRNLKFFTFNSQKNNLGLVHTCQSSEIIAHEAGHSILDILHPEYFSARSLETGSYHESFGDQTALFWNLSHPFLCESIITNTNGNLHATTNNFLSALAEGFGKGLGMQNGLRNADDDISLKSAGREVHALSSVYTGAIYDSLVDAYVEATRNVSSPQDKATKLYDVGRHLRQITLESIVKLVNPEPSYGDFSTALINTAKQRIQSSNRTEFDSLNWATSLTGQFTRRGIPVSARARFGVDCMERREAGVCGTLFAQHAD